MANSLKMDLTDRVIVIRADVMKPEYQELKYRLFKVEGGFGSHSFTMGTALIGKTLFDGETCRFEGYDVERLATEDEIRQVA